MLFDKSIVINKIQLTLSTIWILFLSIFFQWERFVKLSPWTRSHSKQSTEDQNPPKRMTALFSHAGVVPEV